jgi:hypothetical protein
MERDKAPDKKPNISKTYDSEYDLDGENTGDELEKLGQMEGGMPESVRLFRSRPNCLFGPNLRCCRAIPPKDCRH